MPLNPVLVAPNYGDSPCEGLGISFNTDGYTNGQNWPAIYYNGQLFMLVATDPPYTNIFNAFPAEWFSSPDGGTTWNGPIDSAHAPGFNNGIPVFDGQHTVYVLYSMATGDINYTITPNKVRITTFNLATGLWGSNVGDTAGNYNNCSNAWLRSDGSIIAIFNAGKTASYIDPTFGAQTMNCAIWTAGVWGPEFSVITAFPGQGTAGSPAPSGVLDSANRLHLFIEYIDLTTQNEFGIYQQVTPVGALGPSYDFPSNLFSNGGGPIPCIFENEIILPGPAVIGSGFYMSFFTGAPLANPVFTPSGVAADTQQSGFPAQASTDGTTCYISYPQYDPITGFYWFRQAASTDLVNWTAQSLFEEPSPQNQTLTNCYTWPKVLPGATGYSFSDILVLNDEVASPSYIWFAATPFVPPAGPSPIKITFRGVKRRPCDPVDPEVSEVSGAPSVKRAM